MSSPSRSKRGSRRDVHLDVGVAGGPPPAPAWPAPRKPDPLAVVDPGRDLDLERPLARACGRRRRSSVHGVSTTLAGAGAGRAGLRAHELAEDAARDLLQPARARRTSGRSTRSVPGSAPSPSQRSQAAATSTSTVRVDARERVRELDRDRERRRRRRARGRRGCAPNRSSPKKAEKMSPRFPRSKSARREAAAAQAGVPVAVVELRASRPSRAPRRPRRPRGSAPARRAPSRRRGAARARAAGTPS